MGNHRAEPSGHGRRPSDSRPDTAYVGRRIARPAESPAQPAATPAPTGTGTHYFGDLDHTAELPLVRAQAPGKRRAVRHAGSRGPLFRGLPSAPVLLGVATMAVAIGGVLVSPSNTPATTLTSAQVNTVRPATALSGSGGIGTVGDSRTTLSRSGERDTLAQASGDELVAAAEAQAEERNAALGQLAAQAEKQAATIKENRWFLPTDPVVLTARFGEYGLWASYHTGLDFNGEDGDPIHAIANGVVTFAGFDGSYGNKTVVTLEDGTEIWYCHQTDQYVSVGDVVTGNEIIGTIGSTGHVTGSHLHVEVRPGGGDPVDPYAAFVANGVTP
ncbi:M23 family metallopeptidase [Nocardioides plantarum]|uniref:M23 family metallopeptidase n=1 Tax=Nocardioides plantarum TaxID=29299 RepID=A0ABV5KAH5_9ACTN|nr:M23 family metallopeptidase [Nocardioides plantarum]